MDCRVESQMCCKRGRGVTRDVCPGQCVFSLSFRVGNMFYFFSGGGQHWLKRARILMSTPRSKSSSCPTPVKVKSFIIDNEAECHRHMDWLFIYLHSPFCSMCIHISQDLFIHLESCTLNMSPIFFYFHLIITMVNCSVIVSDNNKHN